MTVRRASSQFPTDWCITQLGEIAQIRTGIAKNTNSLVRDPVRVPYLRVANVQDGYLDLSDMAEIIVERSDVSRFAVLPGDVLMNEGGDRDKLGRGAVWRGELSPCIHQNHVFVVRCGSDVLPDYLNLWSAGPMARRYFFVAGGQSTNLASISKSSLGSLPIALPSPPEQLAIASALRDVDELLAGLDHLIAKKRDIKQAAMQQFLTGQTRLPGFNTRWEPRRLRDHLRFLKNGVNSRAELDAHGEVRYLHYGDIHLNQGVMLSPLHLPCLPAARAVRLDRLRDGDLVIADASEDIGGVCKSVEIHALGEHELVAGLHTIAVRFDREVLADGFKGLLQHCPSFASQVRRLAAGTKVYATTRSHIANIEMQLPPLPEQAAIVEVLSDMDAELTALEARRDKTRALKQGMMQELLTGRTRLL